MAVLFQNVTAVLMDEQKTVLQNAYVAVDGDKITCVGTEKPGGSFAETIDGTGKVLMPGFVNCHTHVPMTAMRGYGGGHNLQDWLNNFIFPAEDKWDDRSLRAAADLGLAEMIASGVTCIADMYMRTGVIAQAVLDAGLSANLCVGGVYFGDPADFNPDTNEDCRAMRVMLENWHGAGDGRILVDASVHGEYTSSAPLWEWMADFARTHKLGMHVHLSETEREHEECMARHGGRTPAAVFAGHGVFDVRTIAAHCVWTTPEDWAILAEKGVTAVHNPVSNLKLGSGVAPVPAMLKAGVNVALGTDGVSSNNSTDLFGEMKLAAILHNGVNLDPQAMDPYTALQMATVNGARALGRNSGKIAAGADADLILVDFDAPNLSPCHDAVENLVYAAQSRNVSLTMARGKILYRNGEFFTIDLDTVKRELKHYTLPRLFG